MSAYRQRSSPARRATASVAVCAAFAGVMATGLPRAAAAAVAEPTPYESFVYLSCDSMPCHRQIYRVPTDRRLTVFALSCAAEVGGGGVVSQIDVRRRRPDGREDIVDMTANRVGVQGNTQYFALRASARTVIDGGDTVNAFIDSTTDVHTLYCFLAGDLTVPR